MEANQRRSWLARMVWAEVRSAKRSTPNPAKIALFLEEAELPYECIPVDTSKGEQHAPGFRAISRLPESGQSVPGPRSLPCYTGFR
jgi:hypothetical protein